MPTRMIDRIGKRTFDIVFAVFLLLLFGPAMVVIWFWIVWTTGESALFTQLRIGYREQIFLIYKFRTMNSYCDAEGNLLPDEQRLTQVGRRLRKLSLDELPQLFNILKGDMSFIGPRPLLVRYLPYYTERERLRHNVRPGITGLAQVSGRNQLNWSDRFELDLQYVNHWTIFMEMQIFWKTIVQVGKKEGVVSARSTWMPDFDEERKGWSR